MDLPAGAATGIGSLPHTDAHQALACVARTAPRLPFWPQLPNRDPAEGMIAQTLGPLRGLPRDELSAAARRAEPGLDERCAAGWALFVQAFATRFPDAEAVKGQLTGPWTLACALLERPPAAADASLLEALVEWVARSARWQAERLRALGLPALVVVDEPCLGSTPPPPELALAPALGRVGEQVRAGGAAFGVHCCAPPPCGLLREAGIDLLAFDAHHGLDGFLADPEAQALRAAGAWILWGLVPTDPGALARCTPEALLARWRAAAPASAPGLVGAACGLAGLTVAEAERALHVMFSLASIRGVGLTSCPKEG